jgi:hypothetical protein
LVPVTGLNVTVGPGTYWLGISDFVANANDTTTMAYSNPTIDYGTLSSNGTGTVWDAPRAMAFTVEGSPSPVPLPPSLLLMATALAGLALFLRRAIPS